MRRVDRLLLKIQEAQRLDDLQLSVALIGKRTESGKWEGTPIFGTERRAGKPSGLQWSLIP